MFSDSTGNADAPYWVLALGPINAAGLYDWAIVSDNLSSFLFVLARDATTFKTQYDAEVLALLNDLGFTGFTKPIATYQGADCVYESAVAPVKTNKINPDTVDTLSVPAYLGLWYQMYADQIVYSTFEKNAQCVTAKVSDDICLLPTGCPD